MKLDNVEKVILQSIYEKFQEKPIWVVSLDTIKDEIIRKTQADQASISDAVESLQQKHLIKLEALPNMFVVTQFGIDMIEQHNV